MALTKGVVLNDGNNMPLLGFGTWQTPKDVIKRSVEIAIDEGYRHIDGAWVYQNEAGIGEAMETKIKEGKITRKDVFITSKLWGTFHADCDVKECLMETLKLIKSDYVDLYLMHWPWAMERNGSEILPKNENGEFKVADIDYVDAWKAMEKLKEEGLAKSIGVSNFNEFQIKRLMKECSVVPAVNQIEVHPYLCNTEMVDFCKKSGIAVTAYSPLGSPQRPWGTPDEPVIMDDPTLVALAKKLGKSVAQVMIRFQIERGVIVIPKSEKAHRIRENAQVFDFSLSESDMKEIYSVNRDMRFCGMNIVKHIKYWPFAANYSE